jgi:hypothetical protein
MRATCLLGILACLFLACGSDSGGTDVVADTASGTDVPATEETGAGSCPKTAAEVDFGTGGGMALVYVDCKELRYFTSHETIAPYTSPSGTTWNYHLYRDTVGDNSNRLSLQTWATKFTPGTTKIGCKTIQGVATDPMIDILWHFSGDAQPKDWNISSKKNNPDPCTLSATDAFLDVVVTAHDTATRHLQATIEGHIVSSNSGTLVPIVGKIDATYDK